ncbi:MAG: zinc-binding dehydrogenase [Clostridiales bacterium]|nr:zinc-binding dehydrogenase [Clostridiales bacterium]
MDLDQHSIESIVRQVLTKLKEPAQESALSVKAGMAQVAMLESLKNFAIREYPIPELEDDDILVKVEGCGVCGTDVHEWKGDPFGYIPLVLGHEGTGEIIGLGRNIKKDSQGNPVKVGDKLVTSVISCGECPNCLLHPESPQLCENQGVYGLITDSPRNHLTGWFASHIVIKKGSTYFVVNELSLDQRMLLELAAVAVHAVQQGKSTGRLHFDSRVVVSGCGPVGLMVTAALRVAGVGEITVIDGSDQRLDFARQLGASHIINFKQTPTLDGRIQAVQSVTRGQGADFAFQCTGNPQAASDVYKFIRRGGGLCEMGFFVDNGNATINPHFDLCKKEIALVGSWTYGAHEYPLTIAFLKRAKELGLPLERMITHRFPLGKMNEAMETNLSMQGMKIAYVS